MTFVVAQLSNPLARKSHPALESVALASNLNKKTLKKALQTTVLIKFDVRDWGGKKIKVQYVTVLPFLKRLPHHKGIAYKFVSARIKTFYKRFIREAALYKRFISWLIKRL